MTEPDSDAFAPHLRRNLLALGADIAFFIGGINFSAWNTILPVFIRHLTSSNLVLGLLPAVRNFGLNVPPILVSPHIESLRRYRGFVLFWTIFERIPFLLLGLATIALGSTHPAALLIIFFLAQLTVCLGGGVTSPAWLHLVSLMIPRRLRGRFFGISSAVGGLIAVGAAALTVEILKRNTFPTNFAMCFMATFAFLVVSYVALALCHEPEAAAPRSGKRVRSVRQYLASLPSFLRRERNFAVFLIATVLGNILMAIAPFVAASTSRVLHASDAQVGAYGVALLAVSTCGSLCWGWLGDHFGYRLVLIGGNIAGLLTMCFALIGLARHDLLIFFIVFGLLGIYTSATQLASFTIVTEFGTVEERPTFISLSSLVLAPVAIFAPIVAGITADAFGYNAIFAVAGISLACAAMLLTVGVQDPRKLSAAVSIAL